MIKKTKPRGGKIGVGNIGRKTRPTGATGPGAMNQKERNLLKKMKK